jgi:hypothetical protein
VKQTKWTEICIVIKKGLPFNVAIITYFLTSCSIYLEIDFRNWVPVFSLNMAILKITLSLGPSFTLKSFFTHQCLLSTKESGLRTKRKSRNIFFMKKNKICTTFTFLTTINESKIKTQAENCFTTNLRGKSNFRPCLLSNCTFFLG